MNQNILKRYFTLSGLLILGYLTQAQFGVNGLTSKYYEDCFNSRLSEGDYSKLKKSTMYYICYQQDTDLDSIQKILDDAWDYCDIKVIRPGDENIRDYLKDKNSAFLSFGISLTDLSVRKAFLQIWKYIDPAKRPTITYASISTAFDCNYQKVYHEGGSEAEEVFRYIGSHPEIGNLKTGIIAVYLKLIEKYLNDKTTMQCNPDITNKEELKNLKDERIYINSTVKNRGNCATGTWDMAALMVKYPHKYKLITFDELNEKILSGEKFYYAIALREGINTSSLSVFNNETGECIYSRNFGGSEFKPARFEQLAKEIGK